MKSLFALSLLLSACALVPAVAQSRDDATVGETVICDTPEQMTKFIRQWNGDEDSIDSAIQEINAEETKPNACSFATWAFVSLKDGEHVGEWTLEQVMVVGVMTPRGAVKIDPPQMQWTAYRAAGETGA